MKESKPIPISRGQGIYLYGEDGKRYLDGISSWWVNLHGHSHHYIAKKIAEQAEQLEHVIFAGFTHKPAVDLASRLLPLLGMDKIFYSDNGSTAVETALKMALQYWYNQNINRTKVICLKNSYHGDTFGAMSASGKNHFNKPFWKQLFDVETIEPSLDQLEAVICEAACFIFEPLILGSGGMRIYSAEILESLIQCCHDHNVLTIADEVMTGFGRTGTLFACDQIQSKPDLICLSKGLTGGFLPLGVTACTEKIFNAFLGTHQTFLHGHSYTANPLACTSALASLDLLLEKTCFEQRAMISKCHQAFCEMWKSHPKLKRLESLGTILALEYKTESTSYFQPLRDHLYHFFLNKGLLLRPIGNVVYVMPPYCIQKEELEWIYTQIISTL